VYIHCPHNIEELKEGFPEYVARIPLEMLHLIIGNMHGRSGHTCAETEVILRISSSRNKQKAMSFMIAYL
jgi:hypothetical protein